jgi:ribosomal protein S12 methylthiotransferase accessory factor
VGDHDSIVLEWREARDVVGLLDGRLNAFGIAGMLEGVHAPELVHFILMAFERQNVAVPAGVEPDAVEGPTALPDEFPAYPEGLSAQLLEAWSELLGGTDVVRRPISGPHGTTVELVLTNDYLRPELLEVAQDDGAPEQLLVRVNWNNLWIGPHLVRGETACVACLQERLRMNLSARALAHLDAEARSEELVVTRLPSVPPAAAFHRLVEATAGWLAASEDALFRDSLRVLPLDDAGVENHPVFRLPDCQACGDVTLVPPGPAFELRSRTRAAKSGSGYRALDPADTYRRYSRLISPLTGVVRHVRKVPVEGTDLVHVYTAGHAHHYRATTVRAVKGDRRDQSGGKGMTDLDARVSALCESLERVSAVRRGNEPVQIARYSEFQPDALAPNELMLFSTAQFETREAWNELQAGNFQWVPEPYADQAIEWSEVRSLITGETRWVPSAYVYFGFEGEGRRFCKADSNGLAGGNYLEEAILQGLLELIERDAVALWWYNRGRVPGVDLESFGDPFVDRVQAFYPTLGRRLWALDLTTDLRVPCFAAVSAIEGVEREDIVFGFGAHLDTKIALRRALTEVNQMLPTVLRTPEERRKQLLPEFADAIRWWENESLEGHAYLEPAPRLRPTTRVDYPTPPITDLRDAVADCAARVAAAGLDLLVHDLTRPAVGFPVAKVIVPGLRHFWRRLAPGRLYDIPVLLGWVDARKREADMNPISLFV